MTIRYIYHASTQDDADATWNSSTISYLTEQAAYNAYVAGDEFYMAHDHAESGAGASAQLTATAANTPLQRMPVYRVNRSTGNYSPTTGVDIIQRDTTDGVYDIDYRCSVALYGLNFKIGDDFICQTGPESLELIDPYIELTSNSALFRVGFSAHYAQKIKGGTINFSHASGGRIYNGGDAYGEFVGTAFTGNALSTGFIAAASNVMARRDFTACDFSGMNSGMIMIDASTMPGTQWNFRFINCDVPATMTWTDGVFDNDQQILEVFSTDDAGNLYTIRRETLRGVLSEDTSAYYDSGYQDADGDTRLSMKMETRAATTEPHSPLEGLPIVSRITSTGAKTFTVECVENFTAALTKREAWIEVYYLGSATETNWSIADDRELVATSYTNLAAGAGLANWTGEPGGSRSVKLTASATVNQAGLYMVKVFLGEYESGKVLHYDPKVTVS